jgi:class 3 adenylate cyclase
MFTDHETLPRPRRLAERLDGERGHRIALTRSVSHVEHKIATVMFVDVKGSVDLSRRIELENWWSVIDGLFELMCENVYGFGGWVGNFTGDGINAVFDARPDHECHARRACAAALTMRDAIRMAALELHDERGLDLLVRIGINSGEVVTGTLGNRYKRYYTAHGYVVGLAKRIEALAPPDRIYLGEHTASLVRGWAQLHDRGSFDVKGADAQIRAFELVG